MEMKFCAHCGRQIPAEAKFCKYCGTPSNIFPTSETASTPQNFSSASAKNTDAAVQTNILTQSAATAPTETPAVTVEPAAAKPEAKQSAVKICPHCGKEVPAEAKFCRYCGTVLNEESHQSAASAQTPAAAVKPAATAKPAVQAAKPVAPTTAAVKPETKQSAVKTCPHCGKEVPAEAKFCRYCGTVLNEESNKPAATVKPAASTTAVKSAVKPTVVAQTPVAAIKPAAQTVRPTAPTAAKPEAKQPTVKTCPHCGKEIPAEAKFCRYCGTVLNEESNKPATTVTTTAVKSAVKPTVAAQTPVAAIKPAAQTVRSTAPTAAAKPEAKQPTVKTCPHCGKEIPAEAKFCRYCGTAITDQPQKKETPAVIPAFAAKPAAVKPTQVQPAAQEVNPAISVTPVKTESKKTATRICSYCGKEIPAETTICPYCGAGSVIPTAKVVQPKATVKEPTAAATEILPSEESAGEPMKFCPSCGKKIPAAAKFCRFCGYSFEPAAPQRPTAAIQSNNIPPQPRSEPAAPQAKAAKPVRKKMPVFLKVLLILVIIIGGALGLSYVFRSQLSPYFDEKLPISLPFDYELDIPWLHDTSSSVSVTEPAPAASAAAAKNDASSDDPITAAMKAAYGDSFTDADYQKVTQLTVNGSSISLGKSAMPTSSSQTGSFQMDDLKKFTKLSSVTLANISSLSFPSSAMPSVTTLQISNCSVGASASGIQNLTGLDELTLMKTDLQNFDNISKLTSLQGLNVPENQIITTDGLKNLTKLSHCIIYGNNIWDYRGLANVASVDIWTGHTESGKIYTTQRDAASRQIQVLVENLNIRTSPDSSSDGNKTGSSAAQNGYYYILDEYWDTGMNTTWYKIGNNQWIASKEGSWTTLYE